MNTMPRDTTPVTVTQKVLGGIEAVRVSGLTNMLDWPTVAHVAELMEEDETARWIRENPSAYAEGVFRGFEVSDFWSAELADFEDCKCGCGGQRRCEDA
jgi:hypothetical protein